MTDNIITQVSQETYTDFPSTYEDSTTNVDYNSKIHLNIRGSEFIITRDELMSLPESILLCLFPNGVFLDANGQVITNLTEDDVVFVNFDPACFEYIINSFNSASKDLNLGPSSPRSSYRPESAAQILQNKPAIIVLREDLDYYVIPPKAGLTEEQMKHLKLEVGAGLLKNKKVFSGLGYNPAHADEQSLGPAEQHLFDMLCNSGFDHGEIWGSRSMEPGKCVISSLSLVRLRTEPPPTPPELPALQPVSSSASLNSRSRSRIASLATSASRAASRSLSRVRKLAESTQTKLLLFWRKPARKCWWSNEMLEVDVPGSSPVKVHIRRVWTLELSVVGVQ